LKAAIHQPHYFPYPGFFNKLSSSDIFVIMDDVQYDKRFTNRNKILNAQGPIWLTVPINKADKFAPNIDVRINNEIPWREEHWKKLSLSYSNAKFFRDYVGYLEGVYKKEWNSLFELDFETTKKTMEWLGINVPIVRESGLHVTSEGTQRIVDVCKAVGADAYLSGKGGKGYMDEELFKKNDLKLEYQNYHGQPYQQRFTSTFVPDLSIIDMLANAGPESLQLIKSGTQTTPVPSQ
jgi:hypothetical protein